MQDLDIAYLEIKSDLLNSFSAEKFKEWMYLDKFGNKTETIQYQEDLIRELEKEERYDLLILLRDDKK